MELKGKKINFLGDSITEGCGTTENDKIFLNVLKEECELKEARNYGIGGTRIAHQIPVDPADAFCVRYKEMDDDADVIVVFGGTNDYGHGKAPMGEFCDKTIFTFYGACRVLIEGLIEKYPNSEIVFMTPLHRLNEINSEEKKNLGTEYISAVNPLKKYVDVIKEVCEYYAVPVLDLYSVSGIQPNVDVIKELYCPDGLHPNDLGHIKIKNKLKAFLKNL